MTDLKRHWQDELLKNVRQAAIQTGPQPTHVEGVSVLRWDAPVPKRRNRWTASAGLIIQGEKDIEVGTNSLRLSAMNFLISPFDLPVTSEIVKASSMKPFMVLTVKLDPLLMRELAFESKNVNLMSSRRGPGAISGKAGFELIEAYARLSRLIISPTHQKNLATVLIKEIYCHLLNSSRGPSIRQFLESGSLMNKMFEAIITMHDDLPGKLNIDALAETANMSRATFFRNFQLATAMSPVQYQKHLRLLEARRLLSKGGETVETAGFRVGYKSTSQFSREYLRYFGQSPSQDIQKL